MLGVGILWEGRHLPFGRLSAPGPRFYPAILASLLILLSLILIISEGKKKSGKGTLPSWTGSLQQVLPVYAALLAYFFFMEYLGFAIAAVLLMTFLFAKVAALRWYGAVSGALISTGMAYLLFELVLKSHLPRGLLGF